MKTVYNVFCLPFHIVLYLGDLKENRTDYYFLAKRLSQEDRFCTKWSVTALWHFSWRNFIFACHPVVTSLPFCNQTMLLLHAWCNKSLFKTITTENKRMDHTESKIEITACLERSRKFIKEKLMRSGHWFQLLYPSF